MIAFWGLLSFGLFRKAHFDRLVYSLGMQLYENVLADGF
ncbi:hypothetical protein S7335_175 [Synechococcus sp. PCC 7335]|nr:hypothetical protein S7335_175 [Synechococcus sp. PCC 7335]